MRWMHCRGATHKMRVAEMLDLDPIFIDGDEDVNAVMEVHNEVQE